MTADEEFERELERITHDDDVPTVGTYADTLRAEIAAERKRIEDRLIALESEFTALQDTRARLAAALDALDAELSGAS